MGGTKDPKKTGSVDQNSKLDAIKDIIFGQQIQEYDKEFEEIRDSVAKSTQLTTESMEQIQKDILARIDQMQEDLTKRMEAGQEKLMQEILRLNEQKTDRKALGKMLENIGNKLSS